jgi:hypothetical protein
MKLSILIASLSLGLGSNLIVLPLTTIASAETLAVPTPTRIAQVGPVPRDEARRWGIRLNGYQIDYYKKHGVFAKTAEQILTVMDPKNDNYRFDSFKEVQQFYDFVVVEKPEAIYMFTNPRGSGYGGFSTATFFKRGPNRTLSSQKSSGCYSASGPAPEPGIDPSGSTSCPGQRNPIDDVLNRSSSPQNPQPSPTTGSSTGSEGVINEVKKRVPGIFDGIFR